MSTTHNRCRTPGARAPRGLARVRDSGALLTLARRRAAITARTPRQIAVPLLGPMLLALIAGPALKKATGGLHSGIDYAAFIDVGTVGLADPAELRVRRAERAGRPQRGRATRAARGAAAAWLPGARQPDRRARPGGAAGDRAAVAGRAARRTLRHLRVAGWPGSWRPRCCSRCSCTGSPRRSRAGSTSRRTSSARRRRWRSCRSSSRVRCSRSLRCRACSRRSRSSCR